MPEIFWRISEFRDLTGLAGEFTDGRWHTAGTEKRIVYLAEHPAVALIEVLVNTLGNTKVYPEHFQLLKIVTDERLKHLDLAPSQFSDIDPNRIATTRKIGDAWLAARSSALLRVPSIPSPESWNYLLNPLHPDAAFIKVEWAKRLTYDRRLFHLVG